LNSNNGGKTGSFREITIPGDVLDDGRLSDGAKILYGKIARLAYKNGCCWASNKFLDGTATGRNASRQIQELAAAGYVEIRLDDKKRRLIYACDIESKVYEHPLAKNGEPPAPDADGPLAKNGEPPAPDADGPLAKNGEPPAPDAADPPPKMASPLAKSGEPPSPKMATEHSYKTYLLNAAAAPPPEPDSSAPPSEIQTAAAAPLTPQNIKAAIAGIDPSLALSEYFYPRAAAFMAKFRLDAGYPSWLYRQCEIRKPNSFKSLYFTLFSADDMAEQYIALRQAETSPPPDIACPACAAPHSPLDAACPACGLPRDAPALRVELFQKLLKFPPETRDEYFRREKALEIECGVSGMKNFVKLYELQASLQKEFGLETA
jgi:hypothetical protein